MNKLKLFFILLFSLLFITGCSSGSDEDKFKKFVEDFKVPLTISCEEQLNLEEHYEFENLNIDVVWESSDTDAMPSIYDINFYETDTFVTLKGVFSFNNYSLTRDFNITILAATDEQIVRIVGDSFAMTTTYEDKYNNLTYQYNLPAQIKYTDFRVKCTWTSDHPEIINNSGDAFLVAEDTGVVLTGKFKLNDEVYEKEFNVIVKKFDDSLFMNELNKINFANEIEESIELPNSIKVDGNEYPINWESNKPEAISNEGKLSYVSQNTSVTLSANIVIKNMTITKDYQIIVKPISGLTAIEAIIDSINIPTIVSTDIILEKDINGVQIEWTSSDLNTINSNGIINKENTNFKDVKLTAKLTAGKATSTIEFDIKVSYQSHMFLDRTFTGTKENTVIKGSKLVLADNKLSGSYTTDIIECAGFTECVGSYSATSSTTEICELKVRLRIKGTWTKYFTYGEFGKGLENGFSNQTSTSSKMVEDEIMVTSGSADAFQLQLILKRSSVNEKGPIVSLLALAIDYVTHNYSVDITGIKNEVKHDVPKLYQHSVPTIGNIICSVTSSTMLMLYRGYSFEGLADYPHQYMAGILKDYGHNIYGNWAYNCIGMSSFGAISYVKRFYSYNEIIHHLCYVGPVAASIKGTFVTDAKTYTTNGHLIVLTGYKIDGNKIYFYVNDPNIYGVSTRCTIEALTNVNRMVSYIIE